MNAAIKGGLLSGLGFPGLGQMVLKHYLRGLAFIIPSMAGVAALAVKVTRIVLGIMSEINAVQGSEDLEQIIAVVNQGIEKIFSYDVGRLVAVICLLWIFSTVDAVLLGRKIDRQSGAGDDASRLSQNL